MLDRKSVLKTPYSMESERWRDYQVGDLMTDTTELQYEGWRIQIVELDP